MTVLICYIFILAVCCGAIGFVIGYDVCERDHEKFGGWK